MALTAAGLKAKIKTEMDTTYGAAEDATARDKFAEAIATAIIEYLTLNTVVTVTVAGGSSAGPHTGVIS